MRGDLLCSADIRCWRLKWNQIVAGPMGPLDEDTFDELLLYSSAVELDHQVSLVKCSAE